MAEIRRYLKWLLIKPRADSYCCHIAKRSSRLFGLMSRCSVVAAMLGFGGPDTGWEGGQQ